MTAHAPLLAQLDDLLFNPAGWFAIDERNRSIAGVRPATLSAGLALIGRGQVATIVGRLRPGAIVVDVDRPGAHGLLIADQVAGWLRARGCWTLLRPSGGEQGRTHVYGAHPDLADNQPLRDQLAAFVATLRAEHKVSAKALDLRGQIRPLSAPHRHGAQTRPHGELREALRALAKVFPDAAPPVKVTRKAKPTRRRNGDDDPWASVTALHLARRGRGLRPEWRRYLDTGQIPVGRWHDGPTASRSAVVVDRSLLEASATRELAWALGDPATAWRIIRDSHPTAMTKAKEQGWAWWIRVWWNPAVEGAAAYSGGPALVLVPTAGADTGEPAHAPTLDDGVSPEVAAAVAIARTRLVDLMWTQPVRSRPALLAVGHHLLDRIERANTLRVPCPERDLVLDTCIADRKTIRAALRLLDGTLGTLHKDALDRRDRAGTSYEFTLLPHEDPSAPKAEGREIPPPSLHTPQTPRGLWATLPRTAHPAWRTLLAATSPLTAPELASAAGLVECPGQAPTKSQRATAHTALQALGAAGLAHVDEHGRWTATTAPRSTRVDARAAEAYARLAAPIAEERAAYRAGSAATTWAAGQALAFKIQRAKEKAWWDGLSPTERDMRRAAARERFDQMTLTAQAALKARLARGRIIAGVDEAARHRGWMASLTPDEFLERSLARRDRFQRLSPDQRAASVDAWTRHRTRFGLEATTPPAESVEVLIPSPATAGDELTLALLG